MIFNQPMKETTRGGQIFLHNVRMFSQVSNNVVLWALVIAISLMVGVFWMQTTAELRSMGLAVLNAKLDLLLLSPHHLETVTLSDGNRLKIPAQTLLQLDAVKAVSEQLQHVLFTSLLFGLFSLSVGMAVIFWVLQRYGHHQTQDKFVRGDVFASPLDVQKMLKKAHVDSDIVLGESRLPLVRDSEKQHILMSGTSGSGKTTFLLELLDYIQSRNERAIVYDKSCSLIQAIYREDQDILLNPLDSRSRSWCLWQECRDKVDFESLAAAQIPMPPQAQDPFWVNGARTIFAAAAYQMRHLPQKSAKRLVEAISMTSLNEIQDILKGTVAENLVSDKIEKTAISIKAVLTNYLKSLEYLEPSENPFSIRRWIEQEDEKPGVLFISSLANKHETLKPLISTWLDIAVNTLLSLPEDRSRRIWILLDELPSLHQLPYLSSALSEARKFGGCFVLGFQNFAQLSHIYGHNGALAISALLNTRLIFRQPDPDMAAWSAKNLGEQVREEVREGLSYGANTMRDGISISKTEVTKPLISPSEIMRLANLHSYVRLPGNWPICELTFKPKPRAAKNPYFLPRELKQEQPHEEILEEQGENPSSATAENTEGGGQTVLPKASKKRGRPSKSKTVEALEGPDELSPETFFE